MNIIDLKFILSLNFDITGKGLFIYNSALQNAFTTVNGSVGKLLEKLLEI